MAEIGTSSCCDGSAPTGRWPVADSCMYCFAAAEITKGCGVICIATGNGPSGSSRAAAPGSGNPSPLIVILLDTIYITFHTIPKFRTLVRATIAVDCRSTPPGRSQTGNFSGFVEFISINKRLRILRAARSGGRTKDILSFLPSAAVGRERPIPTAAALPPSSRGGARLEIVWIVKYETVITHSYYGRHLAFNCDGANDQTIHKPCERGEWQNRTTPQNHNFQAVSYQAILHCILQNAT